LATRRTKRLGALIQAELAELLLRRVKDQRLEGVVVTGVDVAPDLSQAKVHFSVYDRARTTDALAGFNAAAPFLRRELANRLRLKTMPRLVPAVDESMARAAHLDQVIRRVREADRAAAAARGEEAAEPAEPAEAPEPEPEEEP
jgi:ribosome-binding factor A